MMVRATWRETDSGRMARDAIREIVTRWTADGGRAPSLREVAAESGLKPGTVDHHVRRMVERGDIPPLESGRTPPAGPADRRVTDEQREAVDANRGLIRAIAATIPGVDARSEDVFQAGALGLMRAVQDYDPARGVKFSTYAAYWIGQAVRCEAWDDHLIRVPRYLAGKGGEGKKGLAHMAAARSIAPLVTHRDDGPPNEPWAVDPTQADPEARARAVREAVDRLPARERDLIRRRLEGETLKAIGEAMGVTRERARQIERDAHARLREMLAGRDD